MTGANGYLGTQVLAGLRMRAVPCVATSRGRATGEPCDLLDGPSVRALLGRVRPSVVIHCAASVPKSIAAYDDIQAAEASAAMLTNIATYAQCPVVFASSMTVYGAAPDCPVDERHRVARPPAPGYARGKWIAEQALFARNGAGDVALRLPGLFGLPRRSGLLYNATRAFLSGRPFVLAPQTGAWAAMWVGDAADYVIKAATTPQGHGSEPVNVGYDGPFSVTAAVERIARACGVDWAATPPATRPFSMRLQRLDPRYGALDMTFGQRLDEFVEAVRRDDVV